VTTTATAEGAGSSLDRVRLLKDLQAQARLLEDDRRERTDAEPEFRSALRVEYDTRRPRIARRANSKATPSDHDTPAQGDSATRLLQTAGVSPEMVHQSVGTG
jgi:hypothetical protein